MKSTVTVEISRPEAQVAELFGNPRQTSKWMHDVERIEPVGGELGTPGSSYRLVPRKGNLVFIATVLPQVLPNQVRLSLDSPTVDVLVTGTLRALSPTRTLLVSQEVFRFKGALSSLFGFLAGFAIRKAHRRHIEAFKAFAET